MIQRDDQSTTVDSFGRILVVDDHARARQSMADILMAAGHDATPCVSAIEALNRLEHESYDVVISDLMMPGMDGIEFVRALRQRDNHVQVAMVTAHGSVTTAVDAMRYGAFDFLEKPLRAEQLEAVVDRALAAGERADQATAVAPGMADSKNVAMLGSGVAMQKLRHNIQQVAATSETVLICGESGTGKELVARSVHAASSRCDAAMVSLNCPVLSATLMESELFGHERGAFTGAESRRVGRFELADGGTILLDEISEVELSMQAKLLRVLQERCFEKVGSSSTMHVDVRVLATTNRDLRAFVDEGNFREDLYFRLAVVPIVVPPLRERLEDIPELVQHFAWLAAGRSAGQTPCQLAPSAEDLLANYHWPGNVRELENIVLRATVLCGGESVDADMISPWLIGDARSATSPTSEQVSTSSELPVGTSLEEMERRLIEATLEKFSGHRQQTADALGIGVRTLSGKLRSYGVAPGAKTFRRAS